MNKDVTCPLLKKNISVKLTAFGCLNFIGNIKRLKPVMKGEDKLCLETACLYTQLIYIQYE